MILALLSVASACEPLAGQVSAISAALADIELEQAAALAEAARDDLACQPEPVATLALTSLFQLSGAVALFQGDGAAADEAFAVAIGISPSAALDEIFGEEAAARYGVLREELLATPGGTLTVEGQVEAWLDGRVVEVGRAVDVGVGDHLLQWREPEADLSGRLVTVSSGERRVIPIGEQVVPVAPEPLPEVSPQRTNRPLRIGGTAALATGGVLVALAAGSARTFATTDDPGALDALQIRTNALAGSGLGVTAVGAGLWGVALLAPSVTW